MPNRWAAWPLLFILNPATIPVAAAGCFSGPEDMSDQSYANFKFTNNCGSVATVHFTLRHEDGRVESGSRTISKCSEETMQYFKGQYKFDVDVDQSLTCVSRSDTSNKPSDSEIDRRLNSRRNSAASTAAIDHEQSENFNKQIDDAKGSFAKDKCGPDVPTTYCDGLERAYQNEPALPEGFKRVRVQNCRRIESAKYFICMWGALDEPKMLAGAEEDLRRAEQFKKRIEAELRNGDFDLPSAELNQQFPNYGPAPRQQQNSRVVSPTAQGQQRNNTTSTYQAPPVYVPPPQPRFVPPSRPNCSAQSSQACTVQ